MKHIFLLFSLLLWLNACEATHYVKGRVLSLDNAAIGGVNVLVKGTSFGAATNMTGEFTISVPEGPVRLFFSLIKFRSTEYAFVVREGYQDQITVFLARKNQTFNKSHAVSGELPLDSPLVRGVLRDTGQRPLAGVNVTEVAAGFSAFTDRDGKFTLPAPYGKNTLSFSLSGFKTLSVSLDVGGEFKGELEVVLAANQDTGKSAASVKRLP